MKVSRGDAKVCKDDNLRWGSDVKVRRRFFAPTPIAMQPGHNVHLVRCLYQNLYRCSRNWGEALSACETSETGN